jgi:proline iminopeptidase
MEPGEFATFHESGFGKVAWSIRCEPRIGGGTLGTFEVRVGATDRIATAKMRIYYSTIAPFSRAIRRSMLNRICEQQGDIFGEEVEKKLPGDEIIEAPIGGATHGITIDAPAEAIWPWLVQMGNLRGGWYSYDWLDNAGIPSASRILPEWQDLQRGTQLAATPDAKACFFVIDIDEPHMLLLGSSLDVETGEPISSISKQMPKNYWRTTWAFVCEAQTPDVTRLIVRVRVDVQSEHHQRDRLRVMIMGQIHDFMQTKQLRNLKKRAEQVRLSPPAY